MQILDPKQLLPLVIKDSLFDWLIEFVVCRLDSSAVTQRVTFRDGVKPDENAEGTRSLVRSLGNMPDLCLSPAVVAKLVFVVAGAACDADEPVIVIVNVGSLHMSV